MKAAQPPKMTSSNQHETVIRSAHIEKLSVGKAVLGSDWKAFTPVLSTGAFGTTTTNSWVYKVVGRTLSVRGTVTQTAAGTIGSGSYAISLPTGCVARVYNMACGTAVLVGSPNGIAGIVGVPPGSTTTLQINLVDPTNTGPALTYWGSGSNSNIVLNATTLFLSLSAEIELSSSSPILQ